MYFRSVGQFAWSVMVEISLASGSPELGDCSKKLFPIVVVGMIWGKRWLSQSVLVHCDNQAVVKVVNSRVLQGSNYDATNLLAVFLPAQSEISLREIHILRHLNTGADATSQNNLSLFHSQVPQASLIATPIPQVLMDLLAHQRPDRTFPCWSQLFKTCLWQV